MIIKSYATRNWIDPSTGKEKSKFGPMYVHFKQNCFERFDSDVLYRPGNRFNFSRIAIDKKIKPILMIIIILA